MPTVNCHALQHWTSFAEPPGGTCFAMECHLIGHHPIQWPILQEFFAPKQFPVSSDNWAYPADKNPDSHGSLCEWLTKWWNIFISGKFLKTICHSCHHLKIVLGAFSWIDHTWPITQEATPNRAHTTCWPHVVQDSSWCRDLVEQATEGVHQTKHGILEQTLLNIPPLCWVWSMFVCGKLRC